MSWNASQETVEHWHADQPGKNFTESRVPEFTLPDPLRLKSGGEVKTSAQWEQRREEILELYRGQMFGRSPGRPDDLRFELLQEEAQAIDGKATLRKIAIHSRWGQRHHQFHLFLFLPNARRDRSPAFLLINNRGSKLPDLASDVNTEFWPVETLISRGYACAAFQNRELAPDNAEKFREGVINVREGDVSSRPTDAWGAISAWSWGASRAMDYLETDDRIDAKHVAVLGHSRGGKTSLWTGAQDQRFALTISNNSGCGGASLSRRRFGETLNAINNRFPHWFCDTYKTFNERENELPFDQHMLISLMAPRAVYVTSATKDLWADPRGEFLSLANASPVYALWGHKPITPDDMPDADQQFISGPRGYHIRTGGHGLTLYDWQNFMNFTDRIWR